MRSRLNARTYEYTLCWIMFHHLEGQLEALVKGSLKGQSSG